MPRKQPLDFANFICKFGHKNLLDYANRIVIPAFLDTSKKRTYGSSAYFFYDTKLLTIMNGKEKLYIIAGRFIKNTTLAREQIFVEHVGLQKDAQALESAPSAIFGIILNNHKLLYLHETAHAPDLTAFKTTCSKFINDRHKIYINDLYKKMNGFEVVDKETEVTEKITKKELVRQNPHPTIEIIPMSSNANLTDFIDKFKILKTIEAKLVPTNNEIDLEGIFSGVRGTMTDIGSKATTIKHHNADGLVKDVAAIQLATVVSQGNTIIKMQGEDENGDVMKGDNNNFKVRIFLDNVGVKVSDAIDFMYEAFAGLITANIIVPAISDEQDEEKIKSLESMISK